MPIASKFREGRIVRKVGEDETAGVEVYLLSDPYNLLNY